MIEYRVFALSVEMGLQRLLCRLLTQEADHIVALSGEQNIDGLSIGEGLGQPAPGVVCLTHCLTPPRSPGGGG